MPYRGFILRYLPAILSIVIFFTIWEVVGRLAYVFSLPPFSLAAARVWTLSISGELARILGSSLETYARGFALAILIAFPTGMLLARVPILRVAFHPYVFFLGAIPAMTFIPVMMWTVGYSRAPIFVVVLSSLFPILNGIIEGIHSLDPRRSTAPWREPVIRGRHLIWAISAFMMLGTQRALRRGLVTAVAGNFFFFGGGLSRFLDLPFRHQPEPRGTNTLAAILVMATVGILVASIASALERKALAYQSRATQSPCDNGGHIFSFRRFARHTKRRTVWITVLVTLATAEMLGYQDSGRIRLNYGHDSFLLGSASALYEVVMSADYWPACAVTLSSVFKAVGVAFSVGVPLGCLMVASAVGEKMLRPHVEAFNNVPAILLLSILPFWVSIYHTTFVALVYASVFPIALSVAEGVRHVRIREGTIFLRALGVSLLEGIRVASSRVFGTIFLAELWVGQQGLGWFIFSKMNQVEYTMYVGIFTLCVFAVCVEWLALKGQRILAREKGALDEPGSGVSLAAVAHRPVSIFLLRTCSSC